MHIRVKVRYMELIQILKAINDETRLRVLNLLMKSELCVGEIEYLLNSNQSNLSRHLSNMKNATLITYEKKAQWIFYSINKDILEKHNFIRVLIEVEFSKLGLFVNDLEMLQEYKVSGKSCLDLKNCDTSNCK